MSPYSTTLNEFGRLDIRNVITLADLRIVLEATVLLSQHFGFLTKELKLVNLEDESTIHVTSMYPSQVCVKLYENITKGEDNHQTCTL